MFAASEPDLIMSVGHHRLTALMCFCHPCYGFIKQTDSGDEIICHTWVRLYLFKVYFKYQMNAAHAWRFSQVLFWPPVLCSQQVKVNSSDLFVLLLFSRWPSLCLNFLFIACRSCVCWASGCCWDKRSQRDWKNKRRTVLVSQTFMWRIRRRRVNPGLLFFYHYRLYGL